MTFLNPLAFVLAALAVPIILLYMLRLRRREVVVSSNFLWQRVLRDNAANTPWQKLKRNLFLLLQLLILALIVLALARPALPLPSESAAQTVVLLDASASMQATEPNGQTRWSLAQAEAQRLIGQMGIGDQMLLLRVGATVDVLSDSSGDPVRLRAMLDQAQPGQGRADWETAFTLAAAGAAASDDFRMIIISDGSSGQLSQGLVLPASVPQPRLISVGQQTANAAVSALAVRAADNRRQIFTQVSYQGDAPLTLSIALRLDGVLWRSQEVTLAPDSQQSFTFAVEQPFATVQASLVLPPGRDYLALDNNAWAVAPADGVRRVLLVSADPARYLEKVLAVLPTIQVVQGDPTQPTLPTTPYDAYLFDGYLPTTLPDADLFIVNPPRSSRLFALGEVATFPANAEIVEADHPLTRYLDVSALNIRQARRLDSPDLSALIVADNVPLLLAGTRGNQQVAVLSFALSDSDLPLQIAFPLLMANLLDWFTPLNRLTLTPQGQPADPLLLTLPLEADAARITAPDNTVTRLRRDEPFVATGLLGLYRIEALRGDEVLLRDQAAISLFDEAESQITPLTDVPLSGGVVAATAQRDVSLRDLSGWLALAALAVLLLEWTLYHRQFRPRVGVVRS